MEHQKRRLECPCNIGFTPLQYEISIIIIIIIVVCFIFIIISNNFVIIIIIVSSSSSAGAGSSHQLALRPPSSQRINIYKY